MHNHQEPSTTQENNIPLSLHEYDVHAMNTSSRSYTCIYYEQKTVPANEENVNQLNTSKSPIGLRDTA